MTLKFECLALAAFLALGGAAHAAKLAKPLPLTKAQYEAEKAKIETEYQVNSKLCNSLSGQREEVCEAEAKGRAESLKADLEARYKPSPAASQKAKNVTAEANFQAAKAKCDALKDKAKDRCIKEAKGAREAAIRQAKVEKVQETGGAFASTAGKRTVKGLDS